MDHGKGILSSMPWRMQAVPPGASTSGSALQLRTGPSLVACFKQQAPHDVLVHLRDHHLRHPAGALAGGSAATGASCDGLMRRS